MEPNTPRLNVIRGLIAAASSGGIAQVTVFLMLTSLAFHRWLDSYFPGKSFMREAEGLFDDSLMPFVGCIVIGACTGWATFAPRGRYRISSTLVILFLITIGQWAVANLLDLSPGRRHAIPTFAYECHVIAFVVVPMLIAVTILTIRRVCRAIPEWE